MSNFNTNPGGDLELDTSNALVASGAIGFLLAVNNGGLAGESLKEFVGGHEIDVGASAAWSVINGTKGYAISNDGTLDINFVLPLANIDSSLTAGVTDVQYAAMHRSNVPNSGDGGSGTTGNQGLLASNGGGDDGLFEFGRSGSVNRFGYRIGVGATNDSGLVNTAYPDWEAYHTTMASRNVTLGQRAILDGVEGGYDSGVVGNANPLAHNVLIGYGWDGEINVLIGFNRELTDTENELFENDADYAFKLLRAVTVAASATTDQSNYNPGDTVTLNPAGFGSALNQVTFPNAQTIAISGNQFVLPLRSLFANSQVHVNTPLGESLDLTVTDGTDTATVSLQIDWPDTDGPDFYELLAAAAPYPADSIWPAGTVENDVMRVERINGVINSINTAGVVERGSSVMSLEVRRWDATNDLHSEVDTYNYSTPSDTTPDVFTIANLLNQEANTQIQSAQVTPVGYDAAAPINVTGGAVSINGGAPITSGTISPGDNFVGVVTTGDFGTSGQLTVDIDGISANFDYSVRASKRIRLQGVVDNTTGDLLANASLEMAIVEIGDLTFESIATDANGDVDSVDLAALNVGSTVVFVLRDTPLVLGYGAGTKDIESV